MNSISQLTAIKQSIWYDNIQRGMLENGELARLINLGEIRGITSNPSIFLNAIESTHDYDHAIQALAWSGYTAEEIFYQLAIEDIRAAADLLTPIYKETNGIDGYVSLEVSPLLAHNTEETIAEAKRLWIQVDRPNLMVKIPATAEGIFAIRQAIAAGINVNATLIFSLERYTQVMDAYLGGLNARHKAGLPIDRVVSVASFFVSRLDTRIDKHLSQIIQKGGQLSILACELLGKAAIAHSRRAYQLFRKAFSSEQFIRLQQIGALLQRPLWASTSTKNPAYRDVRYVEELVGPDSINTIPPQTLEAFLDHGQVLGLTIEKDIEQTQLIFENLAKLGISIDEVTSELENEGVQAFTDSFNQLIISIEKQRLGYQSELGSLKDSISQRVDDLERRHVSQRLHGKDATLWSQHKEDEVGIQDRLGWLNSPENGKDLIAEFHQIKIDLINDGYAKVLLLGMGGSSLAPEVLAYTCGKPNPSEGLELRILDSTDPIQVADSAAWVSVERTLFIVSSKSGGTSEVNAFLDYFWASAVQKLGGDEKAAEHFIAITDPGTSLEKLALKRKFRRVILADPTVGGRYSALTAFGLLPAVLIGLDANRLIGRALWVSENCSLDLPAGRNLGVVLGAVMGEAALQKKDKLTILADPEISAIGSWLEQLIAESSGKQGLGIIPVDIEPFILPKEYQNDRVFIYLRLSGVHDDFTNQIMAAGHTIITYHLRDTYDLGGEFYRWEVATAIACSILGINAFDQPDVQDNKNRTNQKILELKKNGVLATEVPIWANEKGQVFGLSFPGLETAKSLHDVLLGFISQASPGDFIALNAYLPRNSTTLEHLQKVRATILRQKSNATTLGFGPRFLHSTGQLHKGGSNKALFIQITRETKDDLEIPGQAMTFGQLEKAQAMGDLEALQARHRRVIRIHLAGADILDLIG